MPRSSDPQLARLDFDHWRDLPAAISRLYRAGDAETARLRAAHINAVVRLTPATMAANIGSAMVTLWAFSPALGPGLWIWFTALTLFCGLGLVGWRQRQLRPRDTASPRALRRATWQAATLAGLWAVLTATWFGTGTQAQQMTIATLVTGMIGAGGFVLSPMPLASLAYVATFFIGALAALWSTGDPALAGVAVLLGLYSSIVALGALAAWRKSTALILSQTRSARQEQLLGMLLQDFEQQAGEALWEVGPDGHLRHESPRLIELLAPATDDERRQPVLEMVRRYAPDGAAPLRQALDAGRPFRDLLLAWGVGSALRHLSLSGKRLFDEAGQTLGWRGVLADVSDKVRSERLMQRLAHSDSLTGLSNRFVLRDALAQALQRGQPLALLSIDLDHFKTVNDSHGHSTGDELLRAVSQRLLACVRPGDLVARLGGDEFAVLVLDPELAPDPRRLAVRLIDTLSESIDVDQRRLRVGASVGVAIDPGHADPATATTGPADAAAASSPATTGRDDRGDRNDRDDRPTVDEMLGRADLALYAAKAAGRGRYEVYAPALGALSQRRLTIEAGLRDAVAQGQLELHWQAKVDIASWQVVGAEALMRWTHPTLGRVNPAEFIVVAEQCGLIDELGRWALNEACRAAAEQMPGLTISVNVSPMQLRDEHFVAQVQQALRQSRLAPARLELEITESVFIGDADAGLDRLHALRDLGVRVALDDFGTGYSSLSYLRRFPFDTLKIDRSFVKEVLLQRDARAIVQMMADLARTLGMETVCEGVETHEQLRAVSEAGCDQVQGYLISPPRPLAELLQLQHGWGPRPAPSAQVH